MQVRVGTQAPCGQRQGGWVGVGACGQEGEGEEPRVRDSRGGARKKRSSLGAANHGGDGGGAPRAHSLA